jgi:threonylcarbamoyladenosine tRNA methylthiotransferase MtaB
MKRRYLTKLYYNRVNKIREVMPDAAIGVDVIVGFPGETEELFMETYNFLNDLPISYLHVFTYSERENTEAADMQGAVPISEKEKIKCSESFPKKENGILQNPVRAKSFRFFGNMKTKTE